MKFSEYLESLKGVNEADNPQQIAQIKSIDMQIESIKKQIVGMNKKLADLIKKKASLGGLVDQEL